jgi:uncharacterized protein YqeY
LKLETLQQEMIMAMKSGNKLRKNTLSDLIAAIKKAAIDKKMKENITEELVNETILKEQKTFQEMIDTCPDSHIDRKEEYKAKKVIIDEFAPKLLTEEKDIENFILALGIEVSKNNRGLIMKELKGKVDMSIANKVLGKMM